MTQADRIRQFTLSRDVEPARRAGLTTVTIRVGDIHDAMGLKSAQPAVAGALGSLKFLDFAGVKLISREVSASRSKSPVHIQDPTGPPSRSVDS